LSSVDEWRKKIPITGRLVCKTVYIGLYGHRSSQNGIILSYYNIIIIISVQPYQLYPVQPYQLYPENRITVTDIMD